MRNVITLIVTFFFILYHYPVYVVRANEVDDLNNVNIQIRETILRQRKIVEDIKKLEAQISQYEKRIKDLNARLDFLNKSKVELEDKINKLNAEIKEQEKLIKETEGLMESKRLSLKKTLNYLYKLSFTGDAHSYFDALVDDELRMNFIVDRNMHILTWDEVKRRLGIYTETLKNLSEAKIQNEFSINESNVSLNRINNEINNIQALIAQNNTLLSRASNTYQQLKEESNQLDRQLSFLNEKHRALLRAELNKLNTHHQVPQKPLEPGKYYFTGRGRDLVEGHGMGMSQYGAYGMALYHNWNYERILTFYYPNTVIADYPEPERIYVTGCVDHRGNSVDCTILYPQEARSRGYLTIDEYLSGLGEVPNSWPAEVIKAQVVAARTYLMGADCKGKRECSICGSARCQVYVGGLGKQPFVLETKGKVILYNNEPIKAFYSASHRGCSSRLSTVWGVPDLDYIQNVTDDPYAFKDYYTRDPYNPGGIIYPYRWIWRTNGYSLEELESIFNSHSFWSNLGANRPLGRLVDVTIEKDVCKRVSRVTLIGTQNVISTTGWSFRAAFNEATPYSDYIYSTEFEFIRP